MELFLNKEDKMKIYVNNVEYKELSKNVVDFAILSGFFIYESEKTLEYEKSEDEFSEGKLITTFSDSEIKLIANADYLALVKTKCENVEIIKKALELEIESVFKNAMSNLDKTPDEERLTFERQEREAREYLASNDESKAPFLKALATSREVDLNDLAQKVVAKADKYAEISAVLIGKRQKALDEIKKAKSKTALSKIKVNFNE